MAKDDRLYAKFTLDFPDSPKIMPLSVEAKWALVEMTIYSRRMMTDGFLANGLALAKWGLGVCSELLTNDPVRPSLIEVENGYQIHDFAEHQSTRAEIEALTEKRKAAGSKGGRASAQAKAKQVVEQKSSKINPETETHITTSRPNSSSPDPDRIDTKRLTNTLVDALKARGVKTPKSLKSWNTAARLLLDTDKRPLDEALRVLAWSQQDPFWSTNILSMPKFREKYDALRLKANEGGVVETRSPEELLRECWAKGAVGPITEMTGMKPDTIRWPEPEPPDFDADAFRLQWRRSWIENNRTEITNRLRRSS